METPPPTPPPDSQSAQGDMKERAKGEPPTSPSVSQPAQPSQKRSFEERLNTWVQIVGILIAAIWGVYTFLEKEVLIPKSAPVNISINLQLKKVATGTGNQASLTAIEMNVAATNPSTREVHLLPSAWMAQGVRIKPVERDEKDLLAEAAKALLQPQDSEIYTVQRHAVVENSPIVATGLLFADEGLKPTEKVARTIIFYVPKDAYDLLDVNVKMPIGEDVSQIKLEWTLNKDHGLEPTFYRVDNTGKRSRIPDSDAYADKRLKLDWEEAGSAVSLWP
jgi:hypothetical protein